MYSEPDAQNKLSWSHVLSRVRGNAEASQDDAIGPKQLCLPGFRDRPFVGASTPNKVVRWVLRLMARTEARDLYFVRKRSRASIDELLGVDDGQRPKDYAAFNRLIQAGTREGTIQIQTPLIALKKFEIVRLGVEVDAPFGLTWSCYSREDQACGVCESCALRLRAFEAAGIPDPILYLAPPAL